MIPRRRREQGRVWDKGVEVPFQREKEGEIQLMGLVLRGLVFL